MGERHHNDETDLDGLTDEERQALEADDGGAPEDETPEDLAARLQREALEEAAARKTAEEAAQKAAGKTPEEIAAEAAAKALADRAAETAAAEATAEAARAPRPFVPEAPKDVEARQKAITDARAVLAEELDTGKITGREFATKSDEITRQDIALQLEVDKHKTETERAAHDRTQLWEATTGAFLEAHRDLYGGNPIALSALDAAIKALAADKANGGKSMEWFVDEAHRNVLKSFGRAEDPKAEVKKDPKTTAQEAAEAARKAGAGEIPPNLGRQPAADGSEAGNDEFAALGRLTGEAYEAAMARLTPAQLARYEAQNT